MLSLLLLPFIPLRGHQSVECTSSAGWTGPRAVVKVRRYQYLVILLFFWVDARGAESTALAVTWCLADSSGQTVLGMAAGVWNQRENNCQTLSRDA